MNAVPEKKHLLIVDDEEHAREGLARLLRREGYVVVTAEDGMCALEAMSEAHVDLVITDLKMPNMDGMTFVRRLREGGFKGRVIVMTAYCGVDSYLEAMDQGAVEYINKPVRIHELKVVIQKVLA
ncbi:MAG: response regulator [Candidatus Schekmanbacteria bacterium]|nr:response regulator [Candidatus Schekmanbacteria bacterium]